MLKYKLILTVLFFTSLLAYGAAKIRDADIVAGANIVDTKILITAGGINTTLDQAIATGQLVSQTAQLDANFAVKNVTDLTKQFRVSLGGGSTMTGVTLSFSQTADSFYSFPNGTTTVVGHDRTQTLTNKTMDYAANTFLNFPSSSGGSSSLNQISGDVTSGGPQIAVSNAFVTVNAVGSKLAYQVAASVDTVNAGSAFFSTSQLVSTNAVGVVETKLSGSSTVDGVGAYRVADAVRLADTANADGGTSNLISRNALGSFQATRVTVTASMDLRDPAPGAFKAVVSAPALLADTNFKLPVNNGTSTFVLSTDGAGNTSWVASAASGSSSLNELSGDVTTGGPQVAVSNAFTTVTAVGNRPAYKVASTVDAVEQGSAFFSTSKIISTNAVGFVETNLTGSSNIDGAAAYRVKDPIVAVDSASSEFSTSKLVSTSATGELKVKIKSSLIEGQTSFDVANGTARITTATALTSNGTIVSRNAIGAIEANLDANYLTGTIPVTVYPSQHIDGQVLTFRPTATYQYQWETPITSTGSTATNTAQISEYATYSNGGGAAAWGSTNTKVARFNAANATINTNTGVDFNCADSATLGWSCQITPVGAGMYAVDTLWNSSTTDPYIGAMGASVFAAEGTTDITVLTDKVPLKCVTRSPQNIPNTLSCTFHLNANDYLWMQTEGNGNITGDNVGIRFHITKVSN